MFVEDNAQEDDQASAELADGEQTDSAESTDTQPADGDIAGGDDSAAETEDSESSEETDEEKPQVVPIERLRQVVEERNDLRESNKVFKALLSKQGLLDDGKTKKESDADLSKYSPKQLDEAKKLLHTVLKDELGVVGTLQEQFEQMRKDREADRKTQFASADNAKMEATLKEFKGEFKKADVEAQVLKWHQSGDPELQALATSPYRIILREMQDMKARKTGKKPKPAPRIPSAGGEESSEKLTPSGNTNKRVRPSPADASAWEDNLARKAFESMTAKDEE